MKTTKLGLIVTLVMGALLGWLAASGNQSQSVADDKKHT